MFSTLTFCIFDTPRGTGHTVPHLPVLSYGKHETRGLSLGSTSLVSVGISWKSDNLLLKWALLILKWKTLCVTKLFENVLKNFIAISLYSNGIEFDGTLSSKNHQMVLVWSKMHISKNRYHSEKPTS